MYRDEKKALQKQNETLKKENGKIEAEKKDLQKKYETVKKEREKIEAEKKALQKQNETLKKENGKVEAEKKALQKEKETVKKEKDKVEAESSKRDEKTLREENQDLQKDYDDLQGENKRLGKEKEDLQKKYGDLQGENKTLGKEKEDLQKDYDSEKERLVKEKEDLQKDYGSLKTEKERLGKEKEALERKYDSEKERLVKEKEDLQKKYGDLQGENKTLGKDFKELQWKKDSLESEKERLVKEKEDLQKNYGSLKKENKRLGKDAFKKKNKIKTPTDNSKEYYEGLENKIKMLEEDFKDLRKNTNTCGYALGREWKKMTEARVNVTLDPDTASPSLTVSEDGSRVRFTGERSAEWPSVLGREGFTSGRHYWEVEVGEKGYWVLGVSTHPHEKSIPEKPGEGYWLVRLAQGKNCTAVSQGIRSGDQIIKLEKICKVWGVYLDHEGGRLSFCNAFTKFHIHTLEGPFPGQVYPIFSPGSHDKGPLIIQRVQHTAANLI